MADMYTQSAFEIETTEKGYKWLSEAFSVMEETSSGDLEEANTSEGLKAAYELLRSLGIDPEDDDQMSEYWGWTLQRIEGGAHIAMDEDGSINTMAKLLRVFLRKFAADPDTWIFFEWSTWCNKPRADHFYGGAVLVTSKKVEFTNTHAWRDDLLKKWKE